MISEKNTLLGHIVESNGSEFVAQLISDEDGFVPEVMVEGGSDAPILYIDLSGSSCCEKTEFTFKRSFNHQTHPECLQAKSALISVPGS